MGWDSILTVISFCDCYTDGLEMPLALISNFQSECAFEFFFYNYSLSIILL